MPTIKEPMRMPVRHIEEVRDHFKKPGPEVSFVQKYEGREYTLTLRSKLSRELTTRRFNMEQLPGLLREHLFRSGLRGYLEEILTAKVPLERKKELLLGLIRRDPFFRIIFSMNTPQEIESAVHDLLEVHRITYNSTSARSIEPYLYRG